MIRELQQNIHVQRVQSLLLRHDKRTKLKSTAGNRDLLTIQTSFGQCACPMLCQTHKVLDFTGGADADRTRDLLNAIQALSQTELQPHRPHETP